MARRRARCMMLGFLVFALLPGLPSPLAAALLTYDFSGTIDYKSPESGDPQQIFEDVVIGMSFSGTLVDDLTLYRKYYSGSDYSACERLPPLPPSEPITITFGDFTLTGHPTFLYAGTDPLGDYLEFHDPAPSLIRPVLNIQYALDDLLLILHDPSGTALTNKDCSSGLDPSKFPDDRRFHFYAQYPQGGGLYIGGQIAQFYRVIPVALDIKPGESRNVINLKSQGKIPVAILSTVAFAAPAEVDPISLRFGRTGEEVSLVNCDTDDVNADGLLDLVCTFSTQAAAFQPTDTKGFLKGATMTGIRIRGSDAIRVK